MTTFTIPAGATGFTDFRASPLPLVDLKRLRAAWHTGARLADCRTGALIEQCYPESFHTVTMVDRHGTVLHVALCHMHYPLIAFVTDQPRWYTTEFVDPPKWASAYSAVGFETLSADVLLSPLDAVDTSQLTAADRSQIRHWRPPTVGATLFNRWD